MAAFIFAWLFFGMIAVTMAGAKKLHIGAWAVIGAVLGPLAIVLVLMQAPAPHDDWSAGQDRRIDTDGGGGGCSTGCGAGGGCGGGGS